MFTDYTYQKLLPSCLLSFCAMWLYACTNQPVAGEYMNSKPPSGNADTCTISVPSAVFYYPDSLQLEQIKQQTDPSVFTSMMHEYSYQINYSKKIIETTWPKLTVAVCSNCRFLKFLKQNGTHRIIDLNSRNDAYGLYVFDLQKDPVVIDMTNVETGISFYLEQTADN